MRHEADLMDRTLRGLAAAICILAGGCAVDQMYGGLTQREYGHYREEFSALMPLALAGNPAAQNRVGALYEYGLAGSQDYDAAATWYRKAANGGDADAQFNLSYLYRSGLGVPASKGEAFRLAKAAADQGHPLAIGSLGMMYADGAGVEKDATRARELIKRAADAGVPRYVYEFAILERQRSGYKSGELLFKKAANAGVSDAATIVALEHEPQARSGMIHWFRKSAELGNVGAMSDLGCILIEDGASQKDVLEGIHWLWRSVDLSGGDTALYLVAAYSDGTLKADAVKLALLRLLHLEPYRGVDTDKALDEERGKALAGLTDGQRREAERLFDLWIQRKITSDDLAIEEDVEWPQFRKARPCSSLTGL